MRLAAILFSVLILATSVYGQTITVSERDDYKRPSITTPRVNTVNAGRFSVPASPVIRQRIPASTTCYTLHTLVAEREPDSDATQIVRQRTCTPSSQFEMKSTVQRVK